MGSFCYLNEMTIPSDLYLIFSLQDGHVFTTKTQYLQFPSPMCLHPQCHVWPGDISKQFLPSRRNIKYDQNCPSSPGWIFRKTKFIHGSLVGVTEPSGLCQVDRNKLDYFHMWGLQVSTSKVVFH